MKFLQVFRLKKDYNNGIPTLQFMKASDFLKLATKHAEIASKTNNPWKYAYHSFMTKHYEKIAKKTGEKNPFQNMEILESVLKDTAGRLGISI